MSSIPSHGRHPLGRPSPGRPSGAGALATGPLAEPFPDAAQIAARFAAVRDATLALVHGLDAEDLCAQSMPDASPGKWHLGHTTWFFEVMVLQAHAGIEPLHPQWLYLFNSYYEALGARQPRPRRGLLTRPPLAAVLAYRRTVEERVLAFLAGSPGAAALALVELGIHHEQQHQELLVTDVKHLLAQNPLRPAWRAPLPGTTADAASSGPGADAGGTPATGWIQRAEGGTVEIGAPATGFAYDNERPRHRVWLEPFALADRPVSCGEYLGFIEAGGYRDPQWWLSDGWAAVQAEGWCAPLYWERDDDGRWWRFGAYGMVPVDPAEPVAHLSYYEADAYARFAGARLPTEAEWECIARERGIAADADGDRLDLQPIPGPGFHAQAWEWTASAYAPYPGFRPLAGAAGEYNGKFMSGQMVLRGGSCATPRDHLRVSYRNFFPPAARWQFSGLRLARDLT